MSSSQIRLRQRDQSEKISQQKFAQIDKPLSKSLKIKWIKVILLTCAAVILVPVLVFILWPAPITPVSIEGLSEPPEWAGPYKPNDVMSFAERIYEGELDGPESIVVEGEHLYTGTADGWVNQVNHLHHGQVQKIIRFGTGPCGGLENEATCGRPLGMRMGQDGLLVVADAYYGLFQVNVVTGDSVALYLSKDPVSGKAGQFINDLDIGTDGKIYFTDSSTKWNRNQFPMIFLEGIPNGRLLVYDPVTRQTSQLLDQLLFPNGVQLTQDKKAVLIAETCKARILKYNLYSKQVSVWADNLPGLPDNIRYSKITATYWVGFANLRQNSVFSLVDSLGKYPSLRAQASKVVTINLLQTLGKMFSGTHSKAMAVEFNETGASIRSIHDRQGQVMNSISQVESSDGVLYFGSYHSSHIARLYRKRVPDF